MTTWPSVRLASPWQGMKVTARRKVGWQVAWWFQTWGWRTQLLVSSELRVVLGNEAPSPVLGAVWR